MSGITLHYFDVYSRGEPIRIILNYHGVQFTDHLIGFEEWPQLKTSGFSEFDQMPVLEIDGERLVQSQAIVRYLCQKYGYYPSDPKMIYKVESLCDLKEDLYKSLVVKLYHGDTEGVDKWYVEQAPQFLANFERRLAQHREGRSFFICNYPTMADFHIFESIYNHFLRPSKREKYESLLTTHAPLLKNYIHRFIEGSETLKSYIQNRAERPF